ITPFPGHALVGVEVGTGDGDDDGVDVVRHGTSAGVKLVRPVAPAAVPLRTMASGQRPTVPQTGFGSRTAILGYELIPRRSGSFPSLKQPVLADCSCTK